MSDEWAEWKKAWDAGARSLPEIQAQAEKQRRRMTIGFAVAFTIAGCLVAGAIVALIHDGSWPSIVNALFQLTFSTFLLTTMVVLMWGNWRERTETPDAQLSLMERRWMVRRRLGQVVRWGGTAACVFTEVFGIVVALSVKPLSWWMLARHTAITGAILVFFFWFTARMDKKIATALAELAEQRRLLRESDPGAESLD